MASTFFFRMVLRKSSEISNNKPIFTQYNIFYNYEYFLFHSTFWSLFNHRQRSQWNQGQSSLCCSPPCSRVLLCTHYGPLQCLSTYFRKVKETGVLRPIFPDYAISCDHGLTHPFPKVWKVTSVGYSYGPIFTTTFETFSTESYHAQAKTSYSHGHSVQNIRAVPPWIQCTEYISTAMNVAYKALTQFISK